MTQAPIALTCGEPAGVGPELAIAAWQALRADIPFFWIGDPRHLPKGAPFQIISEAKDAVGCAPTALPVLPHEFAQDTVPGQLNPANAQGVIDVVERAVALVHSNEASAICTSPLHKQALQDGAGFEFPGHTEFLASLAGVDEVVMMLASSRLRVVPVTIHVALADVPKTLTKDLLETRLRITNDALVQQFGIPDPCIAVAGLNPHAGEGGRMGREEIDIITPVLSKLRSEGMTLLGPLSADTMFHERARSGYDVAVCMYHDQALIPIKMLDFDRGVNITLGLPFIRTSPDHGTALDIAGQGIANPTSTIEALKLAHQLALAKGGV